MRKYFIINILISVIFNSIIAQDTILLMESKINVKHNATETFYYGFTVGDDIVLRVEEINGYVISDFSVAEEGGQTLFQDVNVKSIEKTIHVMRENVYAFNITNKNLFKRTYGISILRVPKSKETENFNTNWEWKSIYDTTYQYYQEDSLIGHDTIVWTEKIKEIKTQRTEEIILLDQNESVRAIGILGDNNPRVSIELTLPSEMSNGLINKKIVAWAYWIGVGENANNVWKGVIKSCANIVGSATAQPLVGLITGAVTELAIPDNPNQTIEYSITDRNNSKLFLEGQPYNYIKLGNGSGGYGRISDYNMSNKKYYVNLYNHNTIKKLNVTIKAVALVEITEYEYNSYNREKIKPRYTSVTRKKTNISRKDIRVNAK